MAGIILRLFKPPPLVILTFLVLHPLPLKPDKAKQAFPVRRTVVFNCHNPASIFLVNHKILKKCNFLFSAFVKNVRLQWSPVPLKIGYQRPSHVPTWQRQITTTSGSQHMWFGLVTTYIHNWHFRQPCIHLLHYTCGDTKIQHAAKQMRHFSVCWP